ncbi:MAG: mevalonate kinase [Bdellovibrionia bacterium]
MSLDFQTTAYGKWILAGEHSVLRGSPALVFPLQSKALHLIYGATQKPLSLKLSGPHGQELEMLFWGVLDRACQLLKIPRSDLSGEVQISSDVPVGAGMGASATLCVALTKWLGHLGYLAETEFYEFAKQLENLFHGESSGVDIAVAMSGKGLKFLRNGPRVEVLPKWKPHLYISYSGQRGVTSDCVLQVKNLLAQNPVHFESLDKKMAAVVENCETILQNTGTDAFDNLAQQISIAENIFREWGLTTGSLDSHLQMLKEAGAVAVKPTGSGGGGYALSLWKEEPPVHLKEVLISCF